MTCRIELIAEPRWDERAAISRALDALYDAKVGHPSGWEPRCTVVRDGDAVLDELWGTTYWGWLHVEMLFVPETLRGRGLGGQLLVLAEQEAIRRECQAAWLEVHRSGRRRPRPSRSSRTGPLLTRMPSVPFKPTPAGKTGRSRVNCLDGCSRQPNVGRDRAMTRAITRRATLGAACALAAGSACAQPSDWPRGTVTLIVPFPPGGSTDTVVRILAQKLSADLGRSFIVENRSGAVGTIGFASVARAKPDGYTLAVVPGGTFAMAPHLYKLPYDTESSFVGIGRIASMPMFLVVAQASPFRNVADIVAAARRPGNALNYGHGGIGSSIHLAGELFVKEAGLELQGVPYRGMAPAIQGVLAGETHMAMSPSSGLIPFLSATTLRALAVTTKERSALAPDVPTFAEQGYPGVEVIEEIAMFAPANTPQPVLQRLNQAIAAAFAAPEVKERLAALAVVPEVTRLEDWPAYFKAEHARWGEVIRSRNIKLE